MPRRSGAIFSGLVKRFVWFSGIGLPVVLGRFGFGFLDLGFSFGLDSVFFGFVFFCFRLDWIGFS